MPVLVGGIVLLLAAVALFVLSAISGPGAGQIALIVLGILLVLAGQLAVRGLTSVVAGEARVVQLFGRYRGTIREPGLHWVNPFTRRRRCRPGSATTRPRLAKVNDADGNPIEIAAVVVWQVQRHRQGPLLRRRLHPVRRHPDRDRRPAHRVQLSRIPASGGGELSLRDNAEEITQQPVGGDRRPGQPGRGARSSSHA